MAFAMTFQGCDKPPYSGADYEDVDARRRSALDFCIVETIDWVL